MDFTFRTGSWVDFKAPDVDEVGGFSLTSHPN